MTAALTIGVPTYNRAGPLADLLGSLRPAAEAGLAELLVIDDGSSDGTSEQGARLAHAGLRFLRNEPNLGYGLNFRRLFIECRTPWLLVTADDDVVDPAALPALLAWLERRRPHFVSTQWLTAAGALHRGRTAEGPIRPRDFRIASGHAPGLVYAVDACRPFLPRLEALIRAGDPMAVFYPQVVLAASLLRDGAGWWYPACVVREGRGLPSQLTDGAGRPFADPLARIEQLIALERILIDLRDEADGAGAKRIEPMLRQNARGFYWAVREVFRSRGSEAAARRLDRSALSYLLRHPGPLAARSSR